MIIHFPTPYPDELLYSIIARYHIRSGNVFWKHTLEDLFGKRTISASVFLPSGIGSLVRHLPKNTTLNEQILIEDHTMYPFYTVFLPTEKAQAIYDSMLSDDGKSIYMQSGIMASSIPQNRFLKYCPACAKEDLLMYGELYWHRLHQLPGNMICTKHELWLENSKVPVIPANKHAFVIPNSNNCDLNKMRTVSGDLLECLKDVLVQVDKLFASKFENKTFSHFTMYYRHHLNRKGFATYKGRVYQEELHEAFFKYYPDELLKLLDLEVVQGNSWLANITRKHRKSFHPYYHILLLNFLELDVESMFNKEFFEANPFGKPKWPCLNVVCSEYKKNVIEELTIRSCEKTKKPIGRFTCPSCGFSYTRKGKDQEQDDRYKYTRIMDFGYLWKRELQSLLEENLSYREIARRLNVDPGTVIKYANRNTNETKVKNNNHHSNKIGSTELNRQICIQLQQEHPSLSKTEMRNQVPSTYTFLYRHDREWLNKNSPKLRKPKSKDERVDWQKRDQEILKSVKKAAKKLQNNIGKSKRITVKSIADVIGERALLEQHLDKMPNTKKFIEDVYESEKDFRLRRVKYVIDEMRENGEEIKVWKVLKRAGIKKQFYLEVNEYLDSYD
ncbi:TnsD family Tn7-like transposition protein [Virgibacillus sp. SK37]|uniref:TnsD family Tn7-like transposition protein n=1 Tax=Virgibacillus sp. SK37 TaxID=403957 RepID=UPI0004D1C6DC|nr:TnsD family Tn7-like transposition protein [Virgibacillus sp. SK37]AIF42188.1 Tn7 transposition protein D [Virgibacillus sp. SK37]